MAMTKRKSFVVTADWPEGIRAFDVMNYIQSAVEYWARSSGTYKKFADIHPAVRPVKTAKKEAERE